MSNYILEVCVDSFNSAKNAVLGGANRIELCSNLIIGGTTPSTELFKLVKNNLNIEVNVLIRPRFGDFLYSNDELEIIKNEVKLFKELGADGIVVGFLNKDGSIDLKSLEEIINIAKGMNVTLHRAFDVCSEPFKYLEKLKNIGIKTILTSGQKNNAILGKEFLKDLVKKDKGIDILVGGGVSASNIEELFNYTKANSFHMSGKILKQSLMEYKNKEVNMGIPSFDEYSIFETDANEVNKAREILKKLSI